MEAVAGAYLKKRAVHEKWPMTAPDTAGVDQVVVIPALAESALLFDTLGDLGAQPDHEKARALAVVVVNNRADAEAAEKGDNLRTLARLREEGAGIRLGIVDAASPGRELPAEEGAGLARKIGLDHGLAALAANGAENGRLISLDADTRVERQYLESVRTYFAAAPEATAALIDYRHRPAGGPEAAMAIHYENWMRSHELGLAYAGSPYAFAALGSNTACTARAYAKAGGMNRRMAGEDFYFVQQLARTGCVGRIFSTTVYPSGRLSSRTPFGTGPRIQAYLDSGERGWRLYHAASYVVLRRWLGAVAEAPESDGGALLKTAERIHPELRRFLEGNAFAGMWERFQNNSRDARQAIRLFHGWFDGLRTIRLFHHLRDHGLPEQDLYAALGALSRTAGLEDAPAGGAPETANDWLRETGRTVLYDCGMPVMEAWIS
jgi:GT2 family glycosyltransferase